MKKLLLTFLFTLFAGAACAQGLGNLSAGQVMGNSSASAAPATATSMSPLFTRSFSPTRAGDILYYNGSNWVSLAGNNAGTKFLQQDASGVPTWVSAPGSGTVTSIVCNGVTITTTGTCPPPFGFVNCSITATVAGNNLTVALKDNAGSDPSATSPCNVYFRNTTLATGSWTQVSTTAATSFVANANSTFGITNTSATCAAASSCPFRLWVVGINSGSGLVLGVVALTNASGVLPLNPGTLLTTTACSACATATALGTTYSTAAQTSKPFVILGYLEWGSGLATAGTYASAPTIIQTLADGVRRPGEIVQTGYGSTTTSATTTNNTTTLTALTTSPSISFTPTSSANPVYVYMQGTATVNAAAACQLAVNRTATQVGQSFAVTPATTSSPTAIVIGGLDTPGTTSSVTYNVIGRVYGANTCTFPANTTGSLNPGAGMMMKIEEIMG